MAFHNIERYMARWNYQSHYGEFNLGYRSGSTMNWHLIRIDDPAEFSAMIDLLRNEKPVWYQDTGQRIQTTHSEFVGEGEGD